MADIVVLAGTNGAGKSSIGGAFLVQAGMPCYNPDEYARDLLKANPVLSQEEANALAWHKGRDALAAAIESRSAYAFETTLGGSTISGLLMKASNVGLRVRVWYVGLNSVDEHLRRVAERVARGGHDIPEAKIRERYDGSRQNLVQLLPHLTELRMFDNSRRARLLRKPPEPRLILHIRAGAIVDGCALTEVPDWAKPIVQRALEIFST
jgi:predicted ABC-type ATPase